MAQVESEAGRIDAEASAETASSSMFDQSGVSTAYDPDATPRTSHLPRVRPHTGFWSDVGWTLLFFTTPGNLVMFIIVWVLYMVGNVARFAPLFGLFAYWFIQIFVVAWYMSIIAETAGGEDGLPNFSVSGGLFDSIVVPALQWFGSWLVLIAPAVIYTLSSIAGVDALFVIASAVFEPYDLLTVSDDPALLALVALALFLWPMALMCTSMGGLSSLIRFDLIATTIAKTILPYLLISILVSMARVLPQLIVEAFISSQVGPAPGGGATPKTVIGVMVISFGVKTYFYIVMFRLIGLYYRHFKQRFAWDWE